LIDTANGLEMNIVTSHIGKKAGFFLAPKIDHSPPFMRAPAIRLGIQSARGCAHPRQHSHQTQCE